MAAGDLSKLKLSGSTDGKNIKVAATVTPGTLVHTAHATSLDAIYLNGCNTDTASKKVTVEFGGVISPDDLMEVTIPGESGWVPIVEGHLLTNSLVVRVFCETANVVNVNGYVNRHD